MGVAKHGLAGVTTIGWIAGAAYLGQLAGDAALSNRPPLLPFALLTFLAGFYYGQRRAPTGFYYAGRRREEISAWQVWLAGLTIPVVLHWFVDRLIIEVSVSSTGVSGLSVFLDSILLMTTWWWAVSTSTELRGLEVHPEELADNRGFRYEHPAASVHRRRCFRRLRDRWIAGAALLAGVIAVLGSMNSESYLPVLEAGLYLVAGFGLLALSNLLRNRAIWQIEQIELPEALARRWRSSAVMFVALGAALAMLVPTGYGSNLSGISTLLAGALNSVSISLPSPPTQPNRDSGVVLPPSDMRLVDPLQPARPQTPADDPPPASVAPNAPSELGLSEPLLMVGLLIVAMALAYSFVRVAWKRRTQLRVLKAADHLARLSWLVLLAVISVLRDLFDVGGQVAQSSIATASTRRPAFRVRVPAFRLRSLDEREWLEYMVLSLFRRAEKLGHHRPPSLTAGEYASRLQTDIGIPDLELSLLIDRFHHTRYGGHSPSTDEVNEAKRWWTRLKGALQRVRVRVSRGKPRPRKTGTAVSADLARTDTPLKPNSGEPTGWFRVVVMTLGIGRAVILLALFVVGLVAIFAIPAMLAWVLDPVVFVR